MIKLTIICLFCTVKVLRPSRESSRYVSMEPPRLSSAYLNVPGVSVSHSGCSPACMSHSVQASSPFIGNVSRPCPSASHLFPSFSAVGVVPAPVLAAEALPNYYGFLPGLSLPPSPITYHSSPHMTLPPYPVSQSSMMSTTTPLITHEASSLLWCKLLAFLYLDVMKLKTTCLLIMRDN